MLHTLTAPNNVPAVRSSGLVQLNFITFSFSYTLICFIDTFISNIFTSFSYMYSLIYTCCWIHLLICTYLLDQLKSHLLYQNQFCSKQRCRTQTSASTPPSRWLGNGQRLLACCTLGSGHTDWTPQGSKPGDEREEDKIVLCENVGRYKCLYTRVLEIGDETYVGWQCFVFHQFLNTAIIGKHCWSIFPTQAWLNSIFIIF